MSGEQPEMGLGAWNTVRVWGAQAEKVGPGATPRPRVCAGGERAQHRVEGD